MKLLIVLYGVLFYTFVIRDFGSERSRVYEAGLTGTWLLTIGFLSAVRPRWSEGYDQRRLGACFALIGAAWLVMAGWAADPVQRLPFVLYFGFMAIILVLLSLALALFLTMRRAPGPSR